MDLATEHLTFRFGPLAAPSDISLALPFPTRALVLGPGGSGKTLLLKALAGLVAPTEGRVLWDGQDAARLSRAERRAGQARMGFVFQSDALFDSDTVLANVLLPLVRRGVPGAEAEARAREALAEVGLEGFEAALPETLSGGMRKRVGLARAIVARPEVLLVDEPLAGLDPGTGGRVVELLRRLGEGHTLVVSSPEPLPGLAPQQELHLPRPTREP